MNEENMEKHELVHLTNQTIRANMAARKEYPNDSMKASRLINILADMLSSAQSWEEKHGPQPKNDGGKNDDNHNN